MEHGRLPWPTPEELDDQQRTFYDGIVGGVRSQAPRPTPLTDDEGRLHGPFNPMLTNPSLGRIVMEVGAGLRFSGSLPKWLFESLVLLVAAARGASYEWYAHAPIAQQAGVTDEQLAALRQGEVPPGFDDPAVAVVELALTALRHEQPSEELVRRVEAHYGAAGVTETVIAVGFYDLIAGVMRTWDTPLPKGVADPLA